MRNSYLYQMKELFLRDGRLRSGWRVFSYVVASRLLLFAFSLFIGLIFAAYYIMQGSSPTDVGPQVVALLTTLPGLTAVEILQLGITIGAIYFWRHLVDKRSVRSLGIRLTSGWWREFLLGAILVALMWTFIFVFAVSSLSVSVESMRLAPASLLTRLGLSLVLVILIGFNEELDARGYVLQNLAEGIGFPGAILVSAIYFGILHLLNPGAGLASTIGVALFGVLAALGYWATGHIWMPIGMHAAWNLFEGPIYGFLVSGANLGGVFVLRVNGPEWVTGGTFGPEAGALTIVPMVIMIGAVYFWGLGRKPAQPL